MIPIRNIYYMLAYAFQVLHEQGYKDVAAEDFRNTAELLAAILCKGVSVQIKRGLCRQYITKEEPLASPRGKLEIGESIKTQVLRKKQLVCAYDEFSVNAYTNRIIKTTMAVLLRADITKARKKEIRKLLVFFDGVDTLDAHNINWNIQYDRNNQTYRMIIEICRFVLKGLLQTTADGSTRIMDYADDMTMAKLYEKFILGYYQREHPDIRAYSPQIAWQVTDGYRTLLPTMQSDIVLSNKKTGKTLIIDAKFYTHNMQMKAPYMTQTLHSGNLYQIFTYVKNWDAAPGETVAGMLLYAKTDDAVQPDGDYQMSGNQISVKTLDMNCELDDNTADRSKEQRKWQDIIPNQITRMQFSNYLMKGLATPMSTDRMWSVIITLRSTRMPCCPPCSASIRACLWMLSTRPSTSSRTLRPARCCKRT